MAPGCNRSTGYAVGEGEGVGRTHARFAPHGIRSRHHGDADTREGVLMSMGKLGMGILYTSIFVLFIVLVPAVTYAEFPSNAHLRRTTVSLRMAGFAFGSGVTPNSQGQPTGNGMELVPQQWCGSGFVIGQDGTIVTNYHVARRALRGHAIFDGGTTYDIAHLKVYDPENDIAVLKINATDAFATVKLGDSSAAEERDSVLAAGNGYARGCLSPMAKSACSSAMTGATTSRSWSTPHRSLQATAAAPSIRPSSTVAAIDAICSISLLERGLSP